MGIVTAPGTGTSPGVVFAGDGGDDGAGRRSGEVYLSSLSPGRCFEVGEVSQVGAARRKAAELARSLDFEEERAGRLSLAVTEMGKNIVTHAGRGRLILATEVRDRSSTVEVLALDRGPGMRDVERCLEDGYSTAGTAGIGLGSLRRIADHFEIYSQAGRGTVVRVEIAARRPPSDRDGGAGPPPVLPSERRAARGEGPRPRFEVGAVCVPKPGQERQGDAWAAWLGRSRVAFAVSDGLGHGPLAAEASRAFVDSFEEHAGSGAGEVVEAAHRDLAGSRGAAVAVAAVDLEAPELVYAGVGNIAGGVVSGKKVRRLLSYNGIVGVDAKRIREIDYPWQPGSLLILHSDGIGSSWSLDDYPGIALRHPAVVAAAIYRDFDRGRDDATVLVVRRNG